MTISEVLVLGSDHTPAPQFATALVNTILVRYPGKVNQDVRQALGPDWKPGALPRIIPAKGPADLVDDDGSFNLPSEVINAARLRNTGSITGEIVLNCNRMTIDGRGFVICWVMGE